MAHDGAEELHPLTLDDSRDSFELALSVLPGGESSSPSSSSSSSAAHALRDSRWRLSDYTLLLDLLHDTKQWSLFPLLWPLLLHVDYVLSPSSASWLMDGFSAMQNMSLIIQCMRRIRHQERFVPSSSLYERVMLRCTQANPVWAWQQMLKLLDDLEGRHIRPTTRTFNHALFMCVEALYCRSSNQRRLKYDQAHPPTSSLQTAHAMAGPHLIIRDADKVRNRMADASHQAQPDDTTLAIIVIIDAYAARIEHALGAFEQLVKRLSNGSDVEEMEEVRVARAWAADWRAEQQAHRDDLPEVDKADATGTDPDVPAAAFLRPSTEKFIRKEFDENCGRVEPLIRAAIAISARL